MVRVRYAPSPTGFLHIGNARTALFNYLFAKSKGGSFIVRIEDTDVERNVEGGVESQLNFLKWLGIDWDESIDKDKGFGPYRQLERLDIYEKYANLLLEKGLAYKCYCTPEDLEKEREELKAKGIDKIHYQRKCINLEDQDKDYVIRFKVQPGKTYTFNDIVKGEVTFQGEDFGDFVIMKNNKIPTYNFACVVDDYLMEITHVLRGEDHITNTPRQMMIYDALDFKQPLFGHMTLIVNDEGKKLSKRDESIIQFISQYKDLGYLNEALFNFIGLLGWSPANNEEIMSREEFIKQFDEKRLSTSPATFDSQKLTFINNRYIKELSLEEFIEKCIPYLEKESIKGNEEWTSSLCELFKERMSFISEITTLYNEFINTPFELDQEGKDFLNQDGVNETLIAFRDELKECDFSATAIKSSLKAAGKKSNAKGKMLFMPTRIATTAQMHGPDLPKLLVILGKEKVINRLEKNIK